MYYIYICNVCVCPFILFKIQERDDHQTRHRSHLDPTRNAWMIAAAEAGMLGFHVITYVMVGCKGEGSPTGLISALLSGGRLLLEGKGPYIPAIFRLVKSYNSSTYSVYIIYIYIYIGLSRVY